MSSTTTGRASSNRTADHTLVDLEVSANNPLIDDSGGGNNNNDNDTPGSSNSKHDGGAGGTASKMSQAVWKYIILHILQIVNILLWYYTNGMNGIAMQNFAKIVKDQLPQTSSTLQFLSTFQITAFVTYRQLLLGSFVGYILLLLLNHQTKSLSLNGGWQDASFTIFHLVNVSHWWPLSGLHAVGSLATNVGFMYGKASVIQVIKLLEPFETLLLSQLLFQEGNCSIGIVASMSVVVGAAMSLLKLQSTTPLPQAVIAAVASGLTLSCRNVLQRKHHHQHSSSASGNATGTLSKNVTSTSPQDPPTSSSATAAVQSVSLSDLTKLEKSVLQFTQLSFYSGLWTGVISLVLWLVIMAPEGNESIEETTSSTTRTTPTQVFLWHPLYNVFSMITLGFCSALTHSLLNAGKRVFAICMAMVWFREGFNSKTMAGLLLVGVGGVWYSSESKGAKNAANFSMTNTNNNRRGSRPLLLQLVTEKDNTLRPAVKLATAAILLASLLQFQSN
mmetsp:Transcript_58446/g.142930  ORF Transcript_58446/g.142930 Transcript_58446/m.142930 type:complete len:504 (+) Transcript_58446:275-1786(+)